MKILYEDKYLIVCEKPIGVESQLSSAGKPDMITLLSEYRKEKGEDSYVGLVHRLDRPTGGVMVFAKTSKAASRLSEQMKNGDFDKTYFAVVCGRPREQKAKIISFLKKDEKTNTAMIVPQSTTGAKRAELDYEMLEYDSESDRALVKVKLYSGRGHQIRVQLKSIKCPIYGDQKYGGESMPKVMLHLFAAELCFLHPTTKQKMIFRVYPPENKDAWGEFNLEKHLSLKTNIND